MSEFEELRQQVEYWRGEMEDHNALCAGYEARVEAAEAEVERLTRECLDREATETDARERLRQVGHLLDQSLGWRRDLHAAVAEAIGYPHV